MPFVIKNPRIIKPGTTSDAMVMNVDFAPTLLDMAGLEIPSQMQGKVSKRCLKEKISRTENPYIIIIMNGRFGTKYNHIMELEQIDIN